MARPQRPALARVPRPAQNLPSSVRVRAPVSPASHWIRSPVPAYSPTWDRTRRPQISSRRWLSHTGFRTSLKDSSTFEHFLHPRDLGRLIRVHVVRELEDLFVLSGAVRFEQHVDHVDRALMVLDHPDEKQAVEL